MNGAVILAAGRGSRMRELTAQKPKCLMELAGKPLLHWQLDALRAAGLERILVARGYKAECLRGDFETAENERWAETNMLSTLLCADTFAQSIFASGGRLVVSYSDIVYSADHVRTLLTCEADICIAYDRLWQSLWQLRFDDPLADAETFCERDGQLLEIGGKTDNLANIQGQYMGLLAFRARGWQTMRAICAQLGEKTDKTDMTAFLRLLLARREPIGAVAVAGKWCEADSGEDLRKYEDALARGDWAHDWRQ